MVDIEDLMSSEQYEDIKNFMKENDILDWMTFSKKFQRQYRYSISKNMLRHVYI